MTDKNFNSIEEAFKAGREFERNRLFSLINALLDGLFSAPEEKRAEDTPAQKQDYKKYPPAPKSAVEPKPHTMTNWKLYQGQNKAKSKNEWRDLY